MDLNALSKLSSRTDPGKLPVDRNSSHDGFESAFKSHEAAQDAEMTNEAAVSHEMAAKDVPVKNQAGSSETLLRTHRQDVQADGSLPAAQDSSRGEPEFSTGSIAQEKVESNSSNAPFVAKPNNTQDQPSTHPALAQTEAPSTTRSERSNNVVIGNTAVDSVSRNNGNEAVPLTIASPQHVAKNTQSSDAATVLDTPKSQGNSETAQPSVNRVQVASTESTTRNINGGLQSAASTPARTSFDEPTAKTSTAPNPSVETGIGPRDAVTATKFAGPPAMTLLERHLGGHAARLVVEHMPVQQSGTIFTLGIRGDANNSVTSFSGPTSPGMAGAAELGIHPKAVFNATMQNASMSTFNASHIITELNTNASHGDISLEVGPDIRTHLTSTGTTPAAAPPRVDLAASVTHQIADAMRNSTDKSIEIALSPAELGRVRMILNPSETGVTMSILADRPETLELMRRNIDDLTRSFAELGYEDISFSFGHSGQTSDDASQHHNGQKDQTTIELLAPEASTLPPGATSLLAIAPDGIDMRL
ncbi:flagellar hook-length control protein FliK [Tateyamaria armeniaca]|uniref:Flagellar hook-length control protein FliK n=1 Tax=Tateyamaria armeniaca TaxID=2518930 RepID=A0ABW8URA6_9RHOB